MHALVVRFLQEGLDPALVARAAAEGAEVPMYGGDHAGDGGDALEEEDAGILWPFVVRESFCIARGKTTAWQLTY